MPGEVQLCGIDSLEEQINRLGGKKVCFQNCKMQVPGCSVLIFLPCMLIGWAFPNEAPLFPAQIPGVSNQPILHAWGSCTKEDDSFGLDAGMECSPSTIACFCCSFIKQTKQLKVVVRTSELELPLMFLSAMPSTVDIMPCLLCDSVPQIKIITFRRKALSLQFSQSTELYSVDAESKTCTFLPYSLLRYLEGSRT